MPTFHPANFSPRRNSSFHIIAVVASSKSMSPIFMPSLLSMDLIKHVFLISQICITQ